MADGLQPDVSIYNRLAQQGQQGPLQALEIMGLIRSLGDLRARQAEAAALGANTDPSGNVNVGGALGALTQAGREGALVNAGQYSNMQALAQQQLATRRQLYGDVAKAMAPIISNPDLGVDDLRGIEPIVARIFTKAGDPGSIDDFHNLYQGLDPKTQGDTIRRRATNFFLGANGLADVPLVPSYNEVTKRLEYRPQTSRLYPAPAQSPGTGAPPATRQPLPVAMSTIGYRAPFPGGAVPPGADEFMANGEKAYTADTNRFMTARDRMLPLQQAISALERLRPDQVGKGSEAFQDVKQVMRTLGMNIPEDWKGSTADWAAAQKYLTEYTNTLSMGGTNARLDATIHSNPNMEQPWATALKLAKINLGRMKAQYAQYRAFQASGQPMGFYSHFGEWWQRDKDPLGFAYDMLSDKEQKQLEAGMSAPELRRLSRSLNISDALESEGGFMVGGTPQTNAPSVPLPTPRPAGAQ